MAQIPDDRLRLIRHERNRGIPQARNTGLEAARGRFVAWLDSDDLARPRRIEEQLRFLAAHDEVAMVGCCAGKIGADGVRKRGVRVPPLRPGDIGAWLLFRSPFQQSSVTGRAEILKAYPYRAECPVCEDVDVFLRLQRDHLLANLPQVLIDRRIHPGQAIRSQQRQIRERKIALLAEPLARTGLAVSDEDLRRHVYLGKTRLDEAPPGADFIAWAASWLCALRVANERNRSFDPDGVRLATSFFWMLACRDQLSRGAALRTLTRFAASPLSYGLLSGHARGWLATAGRVIAAEAADGRSSKTSGNPDRLLEQIEHLAPAATVGGGVVPEARDA